MNGLSLCQSGLCIVSVLLPHGVFLRCTAGESVLILRCLAGGSNVLARVVRRSEDRKGADRLDTSEFFQQVFENPSSPEPRVGLNGTLFPCSAADSCRRKAMVVSRKAQESVGVGLLPVVLLPKLP